METLNDHRDIKMLILFLLFELVLSISVATSTPLDDLKIYLNDRQNDHDGILSQIWKEMNSGANSETACFYIAQNGNLPHICKGKMDIIGKKDYETYIENILKEYGVNNRSLKNMDGIWNNHVMMFSGNDKIHKLHFGWLLIYIGLDGINVVSVTCPEVGYGFWAIDIYYKGAEVNYLDMLYEIVEKLPDRMNRMDVLTLLDFYELVTIKELGRVVNLSVLSK